MANTDPKINRTCKDCKHYIPHADFGEAFYTAKYWYDDGDLFE